MSDYITDANKLVQSYISEHDSTEWSAGDGMRDNPGFTALFLSPVYAARWSALTRKRISGLLLVSLYVVADRHRVDMTSVYAHRLLKGWAGRSISNRTLLAAFGEWGRTAEEKTADWERLEQLVDEYRGMVQRVIRRDMIRIERIRKLVKEDALAPGASLNDAILFPEDGPE